MALRNKQPSQNQRANLSRQLNILYKNQSKDHCYVSNEPLRTKFTDSKSYQHGSYMNVGKLREIGAKIGQLGGQKRTLQQVATAIGGHSKNNSISYDDYQTHNRPSDVQEE
jgi:hypothetical protein